jgi:hypothetical protein
MGVGSHLFPIPEYFSHRPLSKPSIVATRFEKIGYSSMQNKVCFLEKLP